MKPRFALELSNDAISLLDRAAEGWIRVGRAELGAADLSERIEELRELANRLAPDGFVSKLVLPNSQILYLDIEAPGPDRPSRRNQIRKGLENRTPYKVDDLVFDWSRNGDWVKVAVLAKVTLEEAEEFAEANGFHPVAFVAVPEAGAFTGEPYFGLTSRAAAHLPRGERLDRDQDPVRVIDSSAVSPASTEDGVADHDPAADLEPPEPVSDPEPPKTATEEPQDGVLATPDLDISDVVDSDPEFSEPGISEPGISEPGISEPEIEHVVTTEPAEAEAPFIAIEDEDDELGAPAGDQADTKSAPEETLAVDGADLAGGSEDEAPGPQITAFGDLAEHTTTDGSSAHAGIFQSRRPPGPAGKEGRRVAGIEPRFGSLPDGSNGKAPRLGSATTIQTPPTGIDAVAERSRSSTYGPTLPHVAASSYHGTAGSAVRAPNPETLPNATSGRHAQGETRKAARADNKARAIGLWLAAATVLVIAAVALWFAYLAPSSERSQTDTLTVVPAETATTAPPANQAELAPAVTPPTEPGSDLIPPAESVKEPNSAEEIIATAPAPDSVPTSAPRASAKDLPLPTVSTASPPLATEDSAPDVTPDFGADDAPAVAPGATRPEIDSLGGDAPPAPLPTPVPYGSLLRYDANGLIVATPDGVLSPDGFTLFAGKPPRLPRARPAALTPQTGEALRGKNPRARPEGLVPPVPLPEDGAAVPPAEIINPIAETAPDIAITDAVEAALTPPVDPRHNARKPRPRPASVVARAAARRVQTEAVADAAASAARAEAEAAQAAVSASSPLAVASSRAPAARPKGLVAKVAAASAASVSIDTSAVDAALAEAQSTVAATQQQEAIIADDGIDEPELQGGVPNIPTTRTVTKNATIANAIDLGKINLIGVYGSSSSRRALVRMPNGRYVKVKLGDRLDGGKVAAIGDNQLSYVKNGKTYVLKLLNKA